MLNERGKRILKMLMDVQRPITIERLSRLLGVSERTVRYDLDRIDDWLFENSLPRMNRVPGMGLQFPGSTNQRSQIKELIGEGNPQYYVLSPEERAGTIISELLQCRGFATIDQLAERVSVSRSTIVSDLNSVRRHLQQYGLTLTSRRRYGLQINGEEKIIRRCVVDLLCRHIPQSLTFFDGLDIEGAEGSVRQIEQKLDTTFSDLAFSRLVLYVGFTLKRLQMEHVVPMSSSDVRKLRGLPIYLVVGSVLQPIGRHFNIRVPDEEIAYITEQVLASSVSSGNSGIPMIDIQLTASRLITLVGAELRQDLLSDPQLFQGLVVHMGPAIQRGRAGAPLANPHIEDIKTYQRALFDVVSNCTARLKEQVGIRMVEDEVGYLTLHFAAALERSRLGQLRENVLLVCGAGLGTAKLLSASLPHSLMSMLSESLDCIK